MEKPIYPSKYMRITQKYGTDLHKNSYAIDDGGKDTGIDNIFAPFTGTIKKIYTQDANEVWLESNEPVEYPDGTIDYMTVMFAHNNDVSNLYVNQLIKQGEIFYQEGSKGNTTGNHVHIECGRGKFTGSGWYQNNIGYWSINNGKKPEECLWIDDSIVVLNDAGLNFKKIETLEPIPTPKPDQPEVEPDQPEVEPDLPETEPNLPGSEVEQPDFEPNLIFTCQKSDIYAIRLTEGEKLYIK